MATSLPPLPNAQLIDEKGYPTGIFFQYWQQLTEGIAGAIDAIAAAQAAASAANAAAASANAAAASAISMAAAASHEAALVNSYISPATVVSATKTLISVAAHTRFYADGTSVSVSAGSVLPTGLGDQDDVWYVQPSRVGGTVAYQTAVSGPPQGNDVHVVGSVLVPTGAGSVTGDPGPSKPGYG